jgi:hypothetical protein
MKKLRKDLGRAYLLGYLTILSTLALTMFVLWQHPNQYQFILSFWTEFLKWFVVPLIGVKGLEKIGTRFASRGKPTTTEPKPEGE